MVRPCKKCPFRNDVEPYIRPDRAVEIAMSLAQGGEFYCHETTVVDEDDENGAAMTSGPNTLVCAGSVLTMINGEEENKMLRIAERIGSFDRSRLADGAEKMVHGSLLEWQRSYRPPEADEAEPCNVVESGCEAPAGYAIGGSIVEGTEAAEYECYACGTPVCGNCSTEVNRRGDEFRLCNPCAEGEDD